MSLVGDYISPCHNSEISNTLESDSSLQSSSSSALVCRNQVDLNNRVILNTLVKVEEPSSYTSLLQYQSSLESCQNGKMSCSRTISAITWFRKHKKSLNRQSLNKNSLYKAKSTYLQALSPNQKKSRRNVNQLMNYHTKIKNSMRFNFQNSG